MSKILKNFALRHYSRLIPCVSRFETWLNKRQIQAKWLVFVFVCQGWVFSHNTIRWHVIAPDNMTSSTSLKLILILSIYYNNEFLEILDHNFSFIFINNPLFIFRLHRGSNIFRWWKKMGYSTFNMHSQLHVIIYFVWHV